MKHSDVRVVLPFASTGRAKLGMWLFRIATVICWRIGGPGRVDMQLAEAVARENDSLADENMHLRVDLGMAKRYAAGLDEIVERLRQTLIKRLGA